jgi:hypothetical protein
VAPRLWGLLAKHALWHEGELRAALRAAAPLPPVRQRFAMQLAPLPINCATEASLLPHLAHALALFDDQNGWTIDVNAATFVRDTASLSDLRTVRDDTRQAARNRLAAYVLVWLHPDSNSFDEIQPPLPDSYDRAERDWFVPIAVATLRLLGQPSSDRHKELVSSLAELIRDEYDVRDELDALLATWREISRAPVTQAAVADRWLGRKPPRLLITS